MQKLYYSISEISDIIDEEQHIIRYWEKEFSQLKPKKNRGGNRIYSEKDLNIIKAIKKFLRVEKLSLRGAREKLEAAMNDGSYTLIHLKNDERQKSENLQQATSVVNDNYVIVKKEIVRSVIKNLSELKTLI